MTSSKIDLERGQTQYTSGHELLELPSLQAKDTGGAQNPYSASCLGPQATQITSENLGNVSTFPSTGLEPNGSQEPDDDSAHLSLPTRPSQVPCQQGFENSGKQEDQQSPTTEPNSVVFAPFWSKYNEKAQKYDEALIERLRGSADSLLIFAGLFAATVTAFIIESYKTLSADSGDTALVYLAFISQQLAAASQSAGQVNATMQLPAPPLFIASRSSIKVNILWILSLIFSIISALAATLVQSWLTRYKRVVNRSPHPEQQASERSYYFRGVTQFRLVALAKVLPALLHISLFLFPAGLIVFLFPINEEVARVITGVIMAFAVLYLGITIIPILVRHSPYRTPFTAIYNPLLDLVLCCCIGVIAFCSWPVERLPVGQFNPGSMRWRLRWVLRKFERACDTFRENSWDRKLARTFGDERTAEARDWLISQLTNDDEREAFMKVLVPIFTRPGKLNGDWLKLFGARQPLMPLRYLIPHMPSVLDSCLTPAQAAFPDHSNDLDRHRHLQYCIAVFSNIVKTSDVKPDITFPALLSLRRLRNDQDPFIASHATIVTAVVLTDTLRRSSVSDLPSLRNLPSVRVPRHWGLMDILSWVDSCPNDGFVSRCPIILDVAAVSLLPSSSSSILDNGRHKRGIVRLGANDILAMGECEREDDIIIPPKDYCSVFSLVALNRLLGQFLDRNQLSNLALPNPDSPLDSQLLSRMVFTAIYRARFLTAKSSLPSLSHDLEHTLIRHTETIVNQIESASSNGQAVDGIFGQPGLPPMSSLMTGGTVDSLMDIVGNRLSDPDARSRGSELFNKYGERRSAWFPSTSTPRG